MKVKNVAGMTIGSDNGCRVNRAKNTRVKTLNCDRNLLIDIIIFCSSVLRILSLLLLLVL